MKTKELQIGDLVFWSEESKVVKICQINEYVVWFKDSYNNYMRPLDDIQPIPLTDEILEANGFEYFHRNYASLSREHPFLLRMDQWPDENGLGGVWTICDIIGIRFVHQLQHALRLCGIEKEITIR